MNRKRVYRLCLAENLMVLTVVDDCTRESASIEVDASLGRERGVCIHSIRPGQPVENACVESSCGRFRDESFKQSWCPSMTHARALIAAWRDDYRNRRVDTVHRTSRDRHAIGQHISRHGCLAGRAPQPESLR